MSAPRGSHSKLGQGSISGGGATTPQNTFCFTTQRNIKTLQRHNTHSHSQSQRKTQSQRQVGNTQCIELCTFMYLPTCVHFISMWTRTNQSWLNNQLCLAALYWYHNRKNIWTNFLSQVDILNSCFFSPHTSDRRRGRSQLLWRQNFRYEEFMNFKLLKFPLYRIKKFCLWRQFCKCF